MAICWAEMGSYGRYYLFSISLLLPFFPRFIETQFVGESVALSHSQNMKERWSKSPKPTVLILLHLACALLRTRCMFPCWQSRETSFGHLPVKMFLPIRRELLSYPTDIPLCRTHCLPALDMVVEVHDICSSYEDTISCEEIRAAFV